MDEITHAYIQEHGEEPNRGARLWWHGLELFTEGWNACQGEILNSLSDGEEEECQHKWWTWQEMGETYETRVCEKCGKKEWKGLLDNNWQPLPAPPEGISNETD
jgi:hypothetical protein